MQIIVLGENRGAIHSRPRQTYFIGRTEVHVPPSARLGQVEPLGNLDRVATALGRHFHFSSEFLRDSLAKVLGKAPSTVEHLDISFFQEGSYQHVLRVKTELAGGDRPDFCLIVSKNFGNNELTRIEFANIQEYFQKDPSLIVQPFAIAPLHTPSGDLTMYSTRFYSDYYELGYGLDGLGGRAGFHLHSLNLPEGQMNFNAPQQKAMLREMVALLTAYFSEEAGSFFFPVMVNAGDFMVRPGPTNEFEVKLVTIRKVLRGFSRIPEENIAAFVKFLKAFHVLKAPYAIFLFSPEIIAEGLALGLQRRGLSARKAKDLAGEWIGYYNGFELAGQLNNLRIALHPDIKGILVHDQIMELATLIQTGDASLIRRALSQIARPL